MATFFVGGAIGSQAWAYAYHAAGWTAATVLGAALPAAALLGWLTECPPPNAPAPNAPALNAPAMDPITPS
jgi:drug/metabolite transporter (DMT)-like permease